MKVSVQSSSKKRIAIWAPALTTGLMPATFMLASILSLAGACASDSPPGAAGAVAGAAPSTAAGATASTAGRSASAAAGTTPASSVAGAGAGTRAGTTAVVAGSSAGGSGAPPVAGGASAAGAAALSSGATFSAVLAIFADSKNNCGLCHSRPMIGGGLVFNPTDKMGSYMALVGVMSKGADGSLCRGKTYVVAGQPDASLLYDKLAKAMPDCGVRMPASGTTLTDMEIETVRAWIAAGAKLE